MRNDFKPVHLQQVNAKLDRHVLSSERYQKHDDTDQDGGVKISLWKKFIRLCTTNPFVLPEEFYK
ncbi:MAG: hypothetical protein KC427_03015 [Sulfurovum sp.]|uniref:hypothetical protein n=1 Tax=Sulfurovum sp. TaxID=1969726 RepID=UPI002867DDF7|nr:hypothetical protein [Sulfurovum sp.]MCO4844969.1 hypothetical protein [Sulfurovum sp.]